MKREYRCKCGGLRHKCDKAEIDRLTALLELAKAEHYCTREWDPYGTCRSPFCMAVRAADHSTEVQP